MLIEKICTVDVLSKLVYQMYKLFFIRKKFFFR